MSDQPGGTAMSEEPLSEEATSEEPLSEESQSERGAAGSRDKGGGPGAGPVNRPVGTADHDSDSSVNPLGTSSDDMPEMPAGH